MRDIILFAHIITGLIILFAFAYVAFELKKPSDKKIKRIKIASLLGAFSAWIHVIISGFYYIVFYPPLKALIKAGTWSWAHGVIMETKEHWIFILVPFVTLLTAIIWANGKAIMKDKNFRKMISIEIGIIILWIILFSVMGRIISIAGLVK